MASVATTTAPGGTLSYVGNPDFRGYLSAVAQQNQSNPNGLSGIIGAALSSNNGDPQGGTGFIDNTGQINQAALNAYANAVAGDGDNPSTIAKNIANTLSGYYTTYNGLTSTPSAASANAAPDAAIAGQAGDALQTALQALDASNTSVAASEGQQQNELNSNKAQQNQNYQTTLTQDQQGLTNAETGAKTQGNTDLTSLDRLIASLGGGGSSVESEEIPQLVDRSVASNISGADTTKATNDQNADTAWNTFLNQFGSQQQQLQDQASQQEATNQGAYTKTAQALNAIMAAARTGSIDPSDLSYELESAVGSIPAVVNWTPSFSGTTPVYTPQPLSNFTLNPSQIAAASGVALPTSGASTIPFLASLTGNQQQKTTAPATA